MLVRRILHLTAERLAAYRWQGGQLLEEGEFPADGEGIATFTAWLVHHQRSLFHLLADLADEGFHSEDIPRAFGRDRQALISRKLGQYFYGAPLTLALPQGQSQGARHGERMLFCALTAPQLVESWLGAIRTSEAPLVGVWSIPLVLPTLMQAARGLHDHCLLVTLSQAGLRQTFFRDGQLHFSRLTTLTSGSIEEAAQATASESAKIHHYLVGQRLLAPGAPLPCLVLAHPAQFGAFRQTCRDSDDARFFYLDLPQLAHTQGCHAKFVDSRGDLLFIHLLMRRLPAGQFAAANELRAYRWWQWRFALKAISSVIMAGSLLVAGKLWHDANTLRSMAGQLEQRRAESEQRHRQALAALPEIPLSLDALRALIDAWRPIERQEHALYRSLRHLAGALDDFPSVELESLDWRLDTAAGQPAAAITDLDARLPIGMLNDHRGQITLIDRFVARLASDGAQVKVLRLPFEIESAKSLRSSDQVTEAQAPRFSLRLSHAL